MMNSKN